MAKHSKLQAERSRLQAAMAKHSKLQAKLSKQQAERNRLQAAALRPATYQYTKESTTSPSWPSGQARGHEQWVLDRGAKHSDSQVVEKVEPSTQQT